MDWNANVLTGWILHPDIDLSSVTVFVNGKHAGEAPLELEQSVLNAYPRISHAGRSGYRLALPAGLVSPRKINRVRVIGCQGARPVARTETLLFHRDLLPNTPTPPPHLIDRVQTGSDPALFQRLGFRYYQQLWEAICRHREPG
jgi:hypothetical protein